MSQSLKCFVLFDMLEEIKERCLFFYHYPYKGIGIESLKFFLEILQRCEYVLHQVEKNGSEIDSKSRDCYIVKATQINQAILQGYDVFDGYVLGVDCSLIKQKEGLVSWRDKNPFYLLNVDDVYLDKVVEPLMVMRLFARILDILRRENSFFYQEYHLRMALDSFFYDELS